MINNRQARIDAFKNDLGLKEALNEVSDARKEELSKEGKVKADLVMDAPFFLIDMVSSC